LGKTRIPPKAPAVAPTPLQVPDDGGGGGGSQNVTTTKTIDYNIPSRNLSHSSRITITRNGSDIVSASITDNNGNVLLSLSGPQVAPLLNMNDVSLPTPAGWTVLTDQTLSPNRLARAPVPTHLHFHAPGSPGSTITRDANGTYHITITSHDGNQLQADATVH